MHGTIDKNGNVTIRFNIQEDCLRAPGHNLKYLPCESGCGTVHMVDLNTVSFWCPKCYEEHTKLLRCEKCGIIQSVDANIYSYGCSKCMENLVERTS